jgi:hypothetical protein
MQTIAPLLQDTSGIELILTQCSDILWNFIFKIADGNFAPMPLTRACKLFADILQAAVLLVVVPWSAKTSPDSSIKHCAEFTPLW